MLSVGHMNRSYSAESLDRSTNNLIGADLSFDATLFSPKIGPDQWERVSAFEDDAVLRRARYPRDEILTENDVISNVSKKKVGFNMNSDLSGGYSQQLRDSRPLTDWGSKQKLNRSRRIVQDDDDISFDDVGSDVTLTHIDKQGQLPQHYQFKRP